MGLFGSDKRSRDAAAVITGAGSGIGAAFAVELAKRGGRIVCSDIDEVSARATADLIVADGGQATSLRCDVSQVDDVALLATEAQDWFDGAPTVVINNAGVGAGGLPIGEVSIDDWNWVLNVNLWGPIHGCHVFAPILRKRPARANWEASSTSPRRRPSVRRQAWRPTTSARQACCRCRKPWRPN